MFKTYSMELAGRNLTIETGKFAELANGSVTVKYGETTVMVNVTASKEPRDGIDFFPLSVDFEEKLYSEMMCVLLQQYYLLNLITHQKYVL